MKIDHLILIVLFSLTSPSLLGMKDSVAEQSLLLEEGADSGLSNPKQEEQHADNEKRKTATVVSDDPLQSGQESQKKADTPNDKVENIKPLDLTFEPDFTDYSQENNKFNVSGEQSYRNLFENSDKDRKLELKGEFLRSFEIEEEKYKPIDGAGIRIELNTE